MTYFDMLFVRQIRIMIGIRIKLHILIDHYETQMRDFLQAIPGKIVREMSKNVKKCPISPC